jgi:pimeloyl-ACP methyl ester carboxylesterase
MLRVPTPVAGVTSLDGVTADARTILASITIPTLLCWGRHSKIAPLATGEAITRLQPDAQLLVFDESGHAPLLEEPERFHDEVSRFVASL